MQVTIKHNNIEYQTNLSRPIDISIPIVHNAKGPKCFDAPPNKIEAVQIGNWIGDRQQGSSVNFKNIFINPHGSCTHTECVGHISKEIVNINSVLDNPFGIAQLISLQPMQNNNGDKVIEKKQFESIELFDNINSLIIRTFPNEVSKKRENYTNTNPPYIHFEVLQYLRSKKVKHLLVDLPSVDKEYDGGKLQGHKAYWDYPNTLDEIRTITELIYVDNSVKDGLYLLNIQSINISLDVSPSRPFIYLLEKFS